MFSRTYKGWHGTPDDQEVVIGGRRNGLPRRWSLSHCYQIIDQTGQLVDAYHTGIALIAIAHIEPPSAATNPVVLDKGSDGTTAKGR